MKDLETEGLPEIMTAIQQGNRTSLHLWRFELQRILREDSGGLVIVRRRLGLWKYRADQVLSIVNDMDKVLSLCQIPRSLDTLLREWVKPFLTGVQYMQVLMLMIDDDILSWRSDGQWRPQPTHSVKRELSKVHKATSCSEWHRTINAPAYTSDHYVSVYQARISVETKQVYPRLPPSPRMAYWLHYKRLHRFMAARFWGRHSYRQYVPMAKAAS